jgi:hypothetical protein
MADMHEQVHQQWMKTPEVRTYWDEAYDRTERVIALLPADITWAVVATEPAGEGGEWSRRVIAHDGARSTRSARNGWSALP